MTDAVEQDTDDCDKRLRDQRTVSKQAAGFERFHSDPEWRADLLRLAQRRRGDRGDLQQFDVLPDPQGEEVLVVREQLLVRGDAFDERAGDLAREMGLEWTRVLDGRVVECRKPNAAPEELGEIARALRRKGVPMAWDYISPLSIVMKAEGGVEPSAFTGGAATQVGPGAVRVAVIDTGIDGTVRGDGWLSRIGRTESNIDLLDDIPKDGFLDLGAAHGTFVAGLIEEVAPAAEVVMYKVFDSDGVGSEVDVAQAMVQAVRDGFDAGKPVILNLSLGMETLDDLPPVALEVALEIIRELELQDPERQVLVVAAAGNFGRARPCFPAALPDVVSVAALTQELKPALWSSHGFWVTCSTIGEGVRSTYVEGKEMPEIDPDSPDTFGPDAWARWSGSSFAAPQIAGKIAQIAEQQGLSLRAALQALLATGTTVPGYGKAFEIQQSLYS